MKCVFGKESWVINLKRQDAFILLVLSSYHMWTLFLSQTLNFSVGTSSSSVSCDSTSSHLLFERFLFLSQVLVTADLDFGVKRLQSKKVPSS